MYQIVIGTGAGVFIIYGDMERAQQEIKHCPIDWKITVWDMSDPSNPKKAIV